MQFKNMNSGYSGYAMSNRAVNAYENGEMPISKWTKTKIIEAIEGYCSANSVHFTISKLKKLKAAELKNLVLTKSSWHHTSQYANETNFYSINEEQLESLTDEEIETVANREKVKPVVEQDNKYLGEIHYLEWSGTKKHPKATECELKDVMIEERGSFYYVYNKKGFMVLKKKIGSVLNFSC